MEEEIQRVRIPKGNEIFGLVEAKLGGNKVRVRCQDNKIRICRIPGRLKKRMWVNIGDSIIVELWSVQPDERGDVILKYSKAQAEWLRKRGILKL